jgi:predicted hydrocarbon binding protein
MGRLKDNIKALAEAIERESVLIHRDALIDGYRDVHKFSRFGIDRIISKAAEYGGKKGAKTLRERYGVYTDRLDEALELLTIIAESSRLIDLFEFDLESMEIYVEGSILVEAVGTSDKPVCGPMAGFFKGFLEDLLEKKFEVREVACSAQGHEKCVFKVRSL